MKPPKYKLGDIVIVQPQENEEEFVQATIISAEYLAEHLENWFYGISIKNPTFPKREPKTIYSYEEDAGHAKTKIIDPTL